MKVIEGHLTASEKKIVRYFLENNITEGRVRGKDFFLTEKEGIYTVCIKVMDKGLIPCLGSEIRLSTYVHKIIP